MAHLHFTRTVYKSGSKSATGRVAYITRQPVRELDRAEQQLRYRGEGREDVVFTQSRNIPAWAESPHAYFRAAEVYEGVNRVAYEEWKITLPHELTQRQNMVLMHDLVGAIAGERLPVTYAFHNPATLDGTRQQPHLHLLLSARQHDTHTRTPQQHFQRYNRQHPERGGAEKAPAFWEYGAVKRHRVLIADVINLHLERAGREERVHPDTLAQRAIDREPEPKLLPSESRAYRDSGAIGETMQRVEAIRTQRAAQVEQEQADARAYWDERRDQLGLSREASHADSLAQIQAARTEPRHPTLPRQRAQELTRQEALGHDVEQRWTRPLIGNTRSGIYHTPGHKNYGDVSPQNQVHFWTEREAIQAGFRRAANDHYGAGTGHAQEALSRRERALTQRLARLTDYGRQLGQARALEHPYRTRRHEPPLPVRAQSERVLALAGTYGLGPDLEAERAVHVLHAYLPTPDIEDSLGRAPRGRVFDRERRPPRDGYER
jgi:MobA/MobL family